MSQEQTLKSFSEAFSNFVEQYLDAGRGPSEPVFRTKLREHFGQDPLRLPILNERLRPADHPTLQLALDAFLADGNRRFTLSGFNRQYHETPSITEMMIPTNYTVVEAPVEYRNIVIGEGRTLACVQTGLYLVTDADVRLAIQVRTGQEWRPSLDVSVMAAERSVAEHFLGSLRTLMRQRNAYRGQVIALDLDDARQLQIHVRQLPAIARRQLILPQGLLDRIERQAIRFSEQADKLLAMGRHLKRGLLLYGPPGTGKTLTAMYLASQMAGRTTLLVTGRSQGLIEEACALARTLQPSTIVLEDVDLIAEERTRPGQTCTALLFELLNQMDGLNADADVLFVLTTNRADILEPALAARPGRIDLALEVPPPDADGRRQMFALFSEGLTLDVPDMESFVKRTEGASGAFIRELMRKAALYAADAGEKAVRTAHLDEALHEIVVQGGAVTRSLLGVRSTAAEQ